MKNKYFIISALAVLALSASACKDYPDRFNLTDGLPSVTDIRYANKDVHITQAYMGEIICLLGSNLTSVQQLYFNDQAAALNTSYITDNTLLVAVPNNMPDSTTNKIYLINQSLDTTTVDFQVLPPTPVISAMSCEWAPVGSVVTLYGKYLFDDANVPLTVSFQNADVNNADITFIDATEICFKVPEGAQPGYVSVTTVSGTGTSKFQYKDTRNMLFDWDGSYGDARAIGYGWRDGSKVIHSAGQDSFEALDGNYIVFSGEMSGGIGGTWNEDGMSFNYWPNPDDATYGELSAQSEFAEMIKTYGVGGLALKFECLIPSSNPWMSAGLQLMFSSNKVVTINSATNAYFSSATFPRAIWMPWYTGQDYAMAGNYENAISYDTYDEWVTVTVPLSEFVYTYDINKICATTFNEDYLTGLTFFLWHGGVEGTDCNPVIAIDNIRVVPN